jgi:hypothetical protein
MNKMRETTMIKTRHRYSPTATALAAALMLAACGGGDADAPPTPPPPADTTPPTVAITDNVSEATATGDVTFTFTFSESVGASFTVDDVVVTGGTKGTFTAVSTTQATLVVTPTANSTGNVDVSVAAGKFSDAANNANTAAASATQAYNTVPPVTAYITFDESPEAIKDLGVYGAGTTAAVEAGPTGGNAKALKIVKPAGPDAWGGAYFTVPKVPFTATKKGMTAKVYSSVANSVLHLKVEVPGGDRRCQHLVDRDLEFQGCRPGGELHHPGRHTRSHPHDGWGDVLHRQPRSRRHPTARLWCHFADQLRRSHTASSHRVWRRSLCR